MLMQSRQGVSRNLDTGRIEDALIMLIAWQSAMLPTCHYLHLSQETWLALAVVEI
jgi:hypothetical protein